jgi:hypothetical protein
MVRALSASRADEVRSADRAVGRRHVERQAAALRTLDRHPNAAVTSLIPALSCRSCRPHAPFAELVKLSPSSVAGALNVSRNRTIVG